MALPSGWGFSWRLGVDRQIPGPSETWGFESSVDFFRILLSQSLGWTVRDQWVFESSYCYMPKKYIVACICNHIVIIYEIYRISMWLSGYYMKTTLQTNNTCLKSGIITGPSKISLKKKRFHGLGLPHWRRSAFVLSNVGQRNPWIKKEFSRLLKSL